ncbi:hypothetical protein EVAR_34777_1 [Eumeta japonica]|uniref:Uncharacterized protein n=1 Tax=Eumeta variegata TaxID=151549 RepID=A0A4C1ZHU3_EUMVA|nr:hypothetical protein EVAR_34777_1 [Eumeta japonica]
MYSYLTAFKGKNDAVCRGNLLAAPGTYETFNIPNFTSTPRRALQWPVNRRYETRARGRRGRTQNSTFHGIRVHRKNLTEVFFIGRSYWIPSRRKISLRLHFQSLIGDEYSLERHAVHCFA